MSTGRDARRQRSTLSRMLLCLLLCAGVIAATYLAPAIGQAQEELPPPPTPTEALKEAYVQQGFLLAGPWIVFEVQGQVLVLDAGANETSNLLLEGKTVAVFDENGATVSLDSLKKGTRIAFLSKDNEYVIIILPKEDRSNA